MSDGRVGCGGFARGIEREQGVVGGSAGGGMGLVAAECTPVGMLGGVGRRCCGLSGWVSSAECVVHVN